MRLRRHASLWVVAGVLGGIGAAAGSCAVPGFELVTPPEPQSSTTSSTQSGGAGGQGCVHATWPGLPATSDPGDDNLDFVVAFHKVDFGEKDLKQGARVGYDLDHRCSCQTDGFSCKEPSYAKDDHCDGPGGIDNGTAEIFEKAVVFGGTISSAKFSDDAAKGDWSLLVRVKDYNGQPNDAQISVALYPSPGLDSEPCGPENPVAKWDGTDAWPVDQMAVLPPGADGGAGGGGAGGCASTALPEYDVDQPRYLDPQGYVHDSVLVASLPEAGILLPAASKAATLELTIGFLTGRLAKQDGLWQLQDGLLVGRWKVENVFRTISSIASGGEPLCTDHPVYQLVKNAVCIYPDISAISDSPTAPCDAISFGVAFGARQAMLGTVVKSSAGKPSCDPDHDPALDTCEKKSD